MKRTPDQLLDDHLAFRHEQPGSPDQVAFTDVAIGLNLWIVRALDLDKLRHRGGRSGEQVRDGGFGQDRLDQKRAVADRRIALEAQKRGGPLGGERPKLCCLCQRLG